MSRENGDLSHRPFVDRSPSLDNVLSTRVYRKETGWQISAEQLRKALESARGAVEAEHALVADACGQPISLFNKEDAESRGVPSWAIATYAFVEKLVYIANSYTHCCEVFEAAVEMALHERRKILQGPVLELLAKLDKLAAALHRWLAPLRVARKVFDETVPSSEASRMGGILVPGAGGKDVIMLDEEDEVTEECMAWADDAFRDPGNLPHILGPAPPQESPADSRLHRIQARVSEALDFTIDSLEMLAVNSGLVRPYGVLRPYWQEIVNDQRSPLLRVVLKMWQEYRASSCRTSIDDLELQIGYWNFRGLGAPMRMMCDFSGVNWENVPYEVKEKRPGHWVCHEWDKDDKPILSKKNPFAQLPYVKNKVTGEVVTQSNAVYLYLGRLLSLNGATPMEEQWNEQVLFYVYQMWMETFDLVYPFKQNKDMEAFQKSLKTHFKSIVPSHYEKLESWLKMTGSIYFVSKTRPCTADFNVWEVIDQHEQMASKHSFRSPLSSFPHLEEFHTTIQREPRLQAYFESDNYKLPCNNKMAFFQ